MHSPEHLKQENIFPLASIFTKQKIYLLIFCLVLCLINYGHECIMVNVNNDDEIFIKQNLPSRIWVAQERWTMHLLELILMPIPVLPIVSFAIFSIAISSAVIFLADLFAKSDNTTNLGAFYMAAPFIVSFPTLSTSIQFSYQIYAIGIGIALSLFSIIILLRNRRYSIPVFIISQTLCIGIYQMMILIAPIIFLMLLITERLKIIDVIKYVAFLVGSLILYKLVALAYLAFFEMEAGYIEKYWSPDHLWINFTGVCENLFETIKSYWLLEHDIFLGVGKAIMFVLFFSFYICIYLYIKRRKFIKILYLLGIILCPFILGLFNLGMIPTRSLHSLPLSMGIIVLLGFTYVQNHKYSKYFLIALVTIATVRMALINNRLSQIQQMIFKHDIEMCNTIIEKIRNHPQYRGHIIPLYIVGKHQPKDMPYMKKVNSTIGASVFQYDSVFRVINTMQLTGNNIFRAAKLGEIPNEIEHIPAWPHKRSITILDNIAIVKFSD